MLNWSMIIHDQDVKICQDMWGHKACQLIDLLFDLSVFCSSLYRLNYVEYRLKSCFGNGWDHGWSWSVIEYINIYLAYIEISKNQRMRRNAIVESCGIVEASTVPTLMARAAAGARPAPTTTSSPFFRSDAKSPAARPTCVASRTESSKKVQYSVQ